MKALFQLKSWSFLVCALLISSMAMAQEKKQASPRDSVSGTVAGSTVKIAYGSPSVRGRKIFGGLLPYDKEWRAGANQMTTFETSAPIKVGGKSLPAGKYSLFATPGKNEWKITLNSVTGKWGIKDDGSANDDPSKDVLTITVKPAKAPMTERLTYKIDSKGFSLIWETTAVWVAITN